MRPIIVKIGLTSSYYTHKSRCSAVIVAFLPQSSAPSSTAVLRMARCRARRCWTGARRVVAAKSDGPYRQAASQGSSIPPL